MFVKSKASVIDVVMVVGHLYKHLSGPDNVQLHMARYDMVRRDELEHIEKQ